MSDVRALAAETPPRSDEAARQIARALEPSWGFVAYGVLYCFLAMTIGLLFMIAVAVVLDLLHVSKPTIGNGSTVVMFVGFALAWWPYVRWVRRRRGAARELGRTGQLVTGTVSTRTGDRVAQIALVFILGNLRWSRVAFEFAGQRHELLVAFPSTPPTKGEPCELVYAPGARYALVLDGKLAIPCRVRDK